MSRRMTWVVTTPAAARIPRTDQRPFVSMLTDWGLRDPYAAICHGVVLSIVPEALIVDITHEIEKFSIRHGALMLWCALPYLPIGAHMAVVDPGVGTRRRPIAIETARGDLLIGPDNGLLLPGADRLGGIMRVHVIDNIQYRLPVLTSTFHGRDLFAPAAAHLALGVPLEAIGPEIDASELVAIDWPPVVVRADELESTVIYRDTFGNLKLTGVTADLLDAIEGLEHGDQLEVRFGGRAEPLTMPWAPTFGEVPEGNYLMYEDSYGRLCIAQNLGDAAASLSILEGTSINVRRAALDRSDSEGVPEHGGEGEGEAAEGEDEPEAETAHAEGEDRPEAETADAEAETARAEGEARSRGRLAGDAA